MSGILLISLPNDPIGILIARVLAGTGTGFSKLSFIVHSSEVTVPRLRGIIMTTYSYCMTAGLLLGGAFSIYDWEELNGPSSNTILGVFILVYTILGQIFLLTLFIESPIFLIQKGDNIGATQAMMKLRNESSETFDIRNDILEFKEMLAEDNELSKSIFKDKNVVPIILLVSTKALIVLSFNYGMNFIRINLVNTLLSVPDISNGPIILSSIRLGCSMLILFTIDYFGRKRVIASGGILAGISAILIGTFLWTHKNSGTDILPAIIMSFIYDAVSVLMFSIPDVLCGEAFPIKKKPQSIVFIIVVENILQVILLTVSYGYLLDRTIEDTYLMPIVIGILMLIITILSLWKIPETNKMSIRQSRSKFRNRNVLEVDGIAYN